MNSPSRSCAVYLGSFPPPYGGATKKNDALFRELKKYGVVKKIDFSLIKRKSIRETARYLMALVSRDATFVVGVSGAKTRRLLTMFLSYVNPKAMERSLLIVMGGVASKQIAKDVAYRKAASKYRKIFVETRGMLSELEAAGLDNVEIYPNARKRITAPQRESYIGGNRLRCVFFAQVSYEKGFDVALDAVEKLADEGLDVICDFYGKIPEDQTAWVEEKISAAKHCEYLGVFKGGDEEVIAMLAKYDLLLFPSRWSTEGVPGTLVEALIAGTPCIVPRKSYNADVIADGVSGKVVDDSDPLQFAAAIRDLLDSKQLERLSNGASEAAEEYFMDVCVPKVAHELFH